MQGGIAIVNFPLTADERKFADENHSLLLKFLCQKRLAHDEYYDVAAFGYLKAVRDYLSIERLQTYRFSTICWRYISREIYNYHRRKNSLKDKAETVSLQQEPFIASIVKGVQVPYADDLYTEQQMKLLLILLSIQITKQQMQIVRMRQFGFDIREIARILNISTAQVKRDLQTAETALKELCYEL